MVALQQVLCLEAVVRTRSFREAALALNMSQNAVSGSIARLERELHLTLLDHEPSGTVLTVEGERMLPQLREFLETAERIRRASELIQQRQPQSLDIVGEVRRIALIIDDAMTALRARFDDVSLRFEAGEGDRICADLRSGRAELGVFAREEGTIGLADDITSIPFFDLGSVGVCLPVGHPSLDAPGPIDPRRLDGIPLVITNEDTSIDLAELLFPQHTRGSLTMVDDVSVGLQLVRHGLGAMLISGVTSCMTDPKLPWRALTGAPGFAICLAHLRDHQLSATAGAFVDHIVDWGQSHADSFVFDASAGTWSISAGVAAWFARGGVDHQALNAPVDVRIAERRKLEASAT
ncbi:MAG: putative LysR-family transcriptional regulator [Ilumatobacteraceae bacterium]|nr:putative LysR-family transcriptional regulator [Ilumatobacteraceae bacterium]